MRAFEVIRDFARNAGISKQAGDIVRARLGPSLKFAQNDLAVTQVMNNPGLEAVQADETESSHDLLRWKQRGKALLVAKAVLQCENGRPSVHQRGKQTTELIVCGCLESDNDQVSLTDFLRQPGAFRLDPEISLLALNENAFASDYLVIRAQQEMHLLASPSQFGTVEAADRPATNNRNFQESEEENRLAITLVLLL